jgi:hypothetical protein
MLAVVNDEGPALGADSELAPPACRNALLAAEDRNFFVHPGSIRSPSGVRSSPTSVPVRAARAAAP